METSEVKVKWIELGNKQMRIENTHTHSSMEKGIEQSEKGVEPIWSIGLCTGGVGYKVDKFSHPLSTTSKMTKLTNKKLPLPSFPSITQGIC